MFPYLDIAGFKLRSAMRPEDADILESAYPGFLAQCIENASSYVNARLRKRYGQGAAGSDTPFGTQPPLLVAAGTAPPPVSLVGRPVLGCLRMRLEVTTAGPLATAAFRWSGDGGLTQHAGVTAVALVPLPGTGLSAVFPDATYATDNLYSAATPVPAAVLTWVASLATMVAYARRGADPSSYFMLKAKDDYDQAKADLKEAADSDIGLFDLPVTEDASSAVTTGGPLGYTEASPYTWADLQQSNGTREDHR